MGRSILLAAHLALARQQVPKGKADWPARPSGRLVWLHCCQDSSGDSIRQLIAVLAARSVDLRYLLTAEGTAEIQGDFDQAEVIQTAPPEEVGNAAFAFLDHWRPDLFVLVGSSLPPAAIVEAHRRGIAVLLVNARPSQSGRWSGFLRRGMIRSLLGRTRAILVQDADAARWFNKVGQGLPAMEITGRIEETTEPPGCSEAERSAFAERLAARPVWYAAACPEAEEEAVLAAQSRAMRFSHRILLILSPATPSRGAALAQSITARGWTVARRALDEEPEPDTQVYIADVEAETGLWYRLAPVCYLGGTLSQSASCPNPFDAASLGSAIIHGPQTGSYPRAFARLKAAQATRPIAKAEDLPEAVEAMIAPDRAAQLAHNAWATSSGGAEVADRVAKRILAALDATEPGQGGSG